METIKKIINKLKIKFAWWPQPKKCLCDSFHNCFNCGSMIPPSRYEKHFQIFNYESFNRVLICLKCFENKQGI